MYSIATYTGNGSSTQFTIPCPYLAQAHLVVSVAGVVKTLGTDYTINTGTNKVVFGAAPANAAAVKIQRVTPRDGSIVNFSAGAGLPESDLDAAALVSLYIEQEILDEQDITNGRVTTLETALPGYVTEVDGLRDEAQASADAASTSATQADSAKDAAETARDEAQAAQSASESARDSASTSEANAGSSASEAAGYANDAAFYSSEAFYWSEEAKNALAAQFKGGLAGNAVPNTSALAGDTYRITSAGTSQGKTWAVGDCAIYNGTSGSWTQLANWYPVATTSNTGIVELATTAEATTGTDTSRAVTPAGDRAALMAYVDPIANTRAGRDRLISDGVTSGRGMIYGPFVDGARGWVAGIPVMSFEGLVTIPTAGNNGVILGLSNTTSLAGVAWRFLIEFSASEFRLRQMGATSGSDFRDSVSYTSFRTAYNGMTGWLSVVVTKGTANPVVRWNGVDVSSMFEVRLGGTYPDWMPASGVSTYHIFGDSWAAGTAPVGCLINGTLTDAERQSWITTGKPPYWVAAGGSAALSLNSNFSAGIDGWNAQQGTTTGNVDGIAGVDDVLELNANGAGGAALAFNVGLGSLNGRCVRLRIDVYRPSTNTAGVHINVRDSGSGLISVNMFPTADTWTSFDLTFLVPSGQAADGALQLRLAVGPSSGGTIGASDKVYFKNAKINAVGALSLPLIQRGGVIGDATYIGDNPARLVGMRAITDRKDFIWTATIDTASTGNKQLLGGAVFMDPLQIALDSIDRDGTGAETASVGDGTTATRFTASAARSATRQRLTLTEFYPADNAKTGLYYDITSAGAASTKAKLTVRGHVIP